MQSNLFILSSNYEGLPNVLLEALVLKKFVIDSKIELLILLYKSHLLLKFVMNHITLILLFINSISFKNSRVDELIEMNRKEFDSKVRMIYMREFQEILHEEQPYTFVVVP